MFKQALLLLSLSAATLAFEDISHPHQPQSVIKNLRSFSFPDAAAHDKTCSMKHSQQVKQE